MSAYIGATLGIVAAYTGWGWVVGRQAKARGWKSGWAAAAIIAPVAVFALYQIGVLTEWIAGASTDRWFASMAPVVGMFLARWTAWKIAYPGTEK